MVEQNQNRIPQQRRVVPTGPRPSAPGPAMTPKDIYRIIRAHLFLIIFGTGIGFMFGGASWFLLLRYSPKYSTSTYIKVLPPVEKDPTRFVSPQVNKDIQYGYRSSLTSLIRSQNSLQKLVDRDVVKETDWFKNFSKIKDKRIPKAIKDLKKRLGVSAQRDGEFITVSMTCGSAKESAKIVNEMVDLFVTEQRISKKGEITARLAGLRNQKEKTQQELYSIEKDLDAIRTATKFTDLDEHSFQDAISSKLQRLEFDQSDQAQSIRQLQATVAILKAKAEGPVDEEIENQVERDPTMVMLTQQIAIQEMQLSGRLSRFGENHRIVRQLKESINETKSRRQKRQSDIAEQTRRANLITATNQLVVMQQELEELEKLKSETAARKRDLDLAKVRYVRGTTTRDEIKSRLEELNIQISKMTILADDPETPKVQKMGDAPVPLEVSSPLWYVYFFGGTMLGFMAGVGIAFLIELLNDLVRTPRDVGRFLNIPLLGVIPHADEDNQLQDIDLCHVVRQAPYSIISESYRRFRNNLKLSGALESSATFLVSSGMAGDGKTSIAVNLATTFIAENKKVLLIDANFWKPKLHHLFLENNDGEVAVPQAGLSTYLSGHANPDQIIRPTGLEGFDLMCTGQIPFNPGELISSDNMQKLIEEQKKVYDYIIIDGPPVLLVSDVKSLARFTDATILVFNANATKRGVALRTIRELREVGVQTTGCVLLAVKAMKGGYFHEQHKSHREYQQSHIARSI